MALKLIKDDEFKNGYRRLFFYGQSKSGKTYSADKFKNALFISTDLNARYISKNVVEVSKFEDVAEVIDHLIDTGCSDYDTLVIDLIDDIVLMCEDYVVREYNKTAKPGGKVTNYTDIPWSKGYSGVKTLFKTFIFEVSKLKMDVIFISHSIKYTDNGNEMEDPSIEPKFRNIVDGRVDQLILFKKIRKNYVKMVMSHRENEELPEELED